MTIISNDTPKVNVLVGVSFYLHIICDTIF